MKTNSKIKHKQRFPPWPFRKDDLRVSMERATELQRRLEELDQAVNHQTSRQQLVRVKDVKRRWEAVLSEAVPEVRDAEDEAKQLTR